MMNFWPSSTQSTPSKVQGCDYQKASCSLVQEVKFNKTSKNLASLYYIHSFDCEHYFVIVVYSSDIVLYSSGLSNKVIAANMNVCHTEAKKIDKRSWKW